MHSKYIYHLFLVEEDNFSVFMSEKDIENRLLMPVSVIFSDNQNLSEKLGNFCLQSYNFAISSMMELMPSHTVVNNDLGSTQIDLESLVIIFGAARIGGVNGRFLDNSDLICIDTSPDHQLAKRRLQTTLRGRGSPSYKLNEILWGSIIHLR